MRFGAAAAAGYLGQTKRATSGLLKQGKNVGHLAAPRQLLAVSVRCGGRAHVW